MKYIHLLFLIFFSITGRAQISDDLSLLIIPSSTNRITAVKKNVNTNTSGNEIRFLLSEAFLFYKNYISSQDLSSCNFTPSCSEYAVKAIKAQGLILGIANSFDRLTRCNGMNADNYKLLFNKHLLYDPVRNFKGIILEDEKLPD